MKRSGAVKVWARFARSETVVCCRARESGGKLFASAIKSRLGQRVNEGSAKDCRRLYSPRASKLERRLDPRSMGNKHRLTTKSVNWIIDTIQPWIRVLGARGFLVAKRERPHGLMPGATRPHFWRHVNVSEQSSLPIDNSKSYQCMRSGPKWTCDQFCGRRSLSSASLQQTLMHWISNFSNQVIHPFDKCINTGLPLRFRGLVRHPLHTRLETASFLINLLTRASSIYDRSVEASCIRTSAPINSTSTSDSDSAFTLIRVAPNTSTMCVPQPSIDDPLPPARRRLRHVEPPPDMPTRPGYHRSFNLVEEVDERDYPGYYNTHIYRLAPLAESARNREWARSWERERDGHRDDHSHRRHSHSRRHRHHGRERSGRSPGSSQSGTSNRAASPGTAEPSSSSNATDPVARMPSSHASRTVTSGTSSSSRATGADVRLPSSHTSRTTTSSSSRATGADVRLPSSHSSRTGAASSGTRSSSRTMRASTASGASRRTSSSTRTLIANTPSSPRSPNRP